MNYQEKIQYKALLESDKRYNRNEAKKYLQKINSQDMNKETIDDFRRKKTNYSDENKPIKYNWTIALGIFYTISTILFLLVGLVEKKIMNIPYTDITTIGYSIIGIVVTISFVLNVYCIIVTLINDFRNPNDKIVWIFSLFFIPIAFILFLDIKDSKIIKR